MPVPSDTQPTHAVGPRLDPDSSYSVDDQSQADQAGDLGRLFEETGERQAGTLSRIDDLDFGPRTEVTPGAIIAFDGREQRLDFVG